MKKQSIHVVDLKVRNAQGKPAIWKRNSPSNLKIFKREILDINKLKNQMKNAVESITNALIQEKRMSGIEYKGKKIHIKTSIRRKQMNVTNVFKSSWIKGPVNDIFHC